MKYKCLLYFEYENRGIIVINFLNYMANKFKLFDFKKYHTKSI